MTRKIMFIIATVVFVIMIPVLVSAQPGLPGTPEQAPIDGGLGVLAAMGGAYALTKLKNRKND